ncbi:MAG TPA: molecular chaperone DnaK, partial [Micromonosporaceae bacterium]|nr:molecular chaperone DnaK [Micromonosporaceae bacterium]
RSRAELLIADARQAVQEQAPIDRVRELTTELQSVLGGLQASRSDGRSGAQDAGGSADAGETADEDVIDAEFDRS